MRTKPEIDTEIKALKALKPVGTFKEHTARKIELAIEELEHGYDDTSGEWSELDDSEQDVINVARRWKEGDSSDKVSTGWGALVSK